MARAKLLYKRLETGFVVYSVGPNGTDDGAPSFRNDRESLDNGDYTFAILR